MSTLHLRESNTLEIKVKLSEEDTLRFLEGDELKIELPAAENVKVNGTEIDLRGGLLWEAGTLVTNRERPDVYWKVLKDVYLKDETFCAKQHSAVYPYDAEDGTVTCNQKVEDCADCSFSSWKIPPSFKEPELKIKWNEGVVVVNKHGVILKSCQTVVEDSYVFFGEVLECDFLEKGTVIQVPVGEYKIMEEE